MHNSVEEAEIASLKQLVIDQTHHMLRAQDLIIGLESEANTARALAKSATDREPLIAEITSLQKSVSYRLGRALTSPFRAIRHCLAFGKRAGRAVARRLKAKLSN